MRRIRETARAALTTGGARPGSQVSVVIADDPTVRSLNARYRGLDEVTDVLAFAWEHQGPWEGAASAKPGPTPASAYFPPGRAPNIGEVVVSCPQAVRQAAEKGWTLGEEVALLVVHGVLHLQGFDHEAPEEEARMRALESWCLKGPDPSRGTPASQGARHGG